MGYCYMNCLYDPSSNTHHFHVDNYLYADLTVMKLMYDSLLLVLLLNLRISVQWLDNVLKMTRKLAQNICLQGCIVMVFPQYSNSYLFRFCFSFYLQIFDFESPLVLVITHQMGGLVCFIMFTLLSSCTQLMQLTT